MTFDLPVFQAINSDDRNTAWLRGPMLGYSTARVPVTAVLLLSNAGPAAPVPAWTR